MAAIKNRVSDGQEFPHYDVNTEFTIATFITDESGIPHAPGTTLTVWNSAVDPVVAVAKYVFLGSAFANKWGKLETPYLV